jgi:hypothetical protein
MTTVFFGRIVDGKIQLQNREGFRGVVDQLEGKDVELVLRRERRHRTNSQNRYYWGVLLATWAHEAGYEATELHEALKRKFLLPENPGAPLPMLPSTANLDTKRFGEYVDACVRLAAQMGIAIPPPGMAEY